MIAPKEVIDAEDVQLGFNGLKLEYIAEYVELDRHGFPELKSIRVDFSKRGIDFSRYMERGMPNKYELMFISGALK